MGGVSRFEVWSFRKFREAGVVAQPIQTRGEFKCGVLVVAQLDNVDVEGLHPDWAF